MNRQEQLAIIENQLERSLRNGLHQALKYIEDLPSNTDIEGLRKISAYVELLSFILSFSEFLGSTQNLILASMKRTIIPPKRRHFEKMNQRAHTTNGRLT
jgi:hypothetical protein